MFITKEFTFSAAHQLTKYHGKCERMHGHNYRLEVTVEGEVNENGLVIDFGILKHIVKKYILDTFDHQNLNDFFENPTTEIVAQRIFDTLVDFERLLDEERKDPRLPDEIKLLFKDSAGLKKEIPAVVKLYEVKLWETDDSAVTIRNLEK